MLTNFTFDWLLPETKEEVLERAGPLAAALLSLTNKEYYATYKKKYGRSTRRLLWLVGVEEGNYDLFCQLEDEFQYPCMGINSGRFLEELVEHDQHVFFTRFMDRKEILTQDDNLSEELSYLVGKYDLNGMFDAILKLGWFDRKDAQIFGAYIIGSLTHCNNGWMDILDMDYYFKLHAIKPYDLLSHALHSGKIEQVEFIRAKFSVDISEYARQIAGQFNLYSVGNPINVNFIRYLEGFNFQLKQIDLLNEALKQNNVELLEYIWNKSGLPMIESYSFIFFRSKAHALVFDRYFELCDYSKEMARFSLLYESTNGGHIWLNLSQAAIEYILERQISTSSHDVSASTPPQDIINLYKQNVPIPIKTIIESTCLADDVRPLLRSGLIDRPEFRECVTVRSIKKLTNGVVAFLDRACVTEHDVIEYCLKNVDRYPQLYATLRFVLRDPTNQRIDTKRVLKAFLANVVDTRECDDYTISLIIKLLFEASEPWTTEERDEILAQISKLPEKRYVKTEMDMID